MAYSEVKIEPSTRGPRYCGQDRFIASRPDQDERDVIKCQVDHDLSAAGDIDASSNTAYGEVKLESAVQNAAYEDAEGCYEVLQSQPIYATCNS